MQNSANDPGKIQNVVAGPWGKGEGAVIFAQMIASFLKIAFIIGGIALLFMIIWGAITWITANGDPKNIETAQKRIYGSIIGFVLLAMASVIVTFLGFIFKIDFLQNFIITWPTPVPVP